MGVTVTLDPAVLDRLRRYGHTGMTYEEILIALMDRLDQQAFVRELRRLAAEAAEHDLWVELDDDAPREDNADPAP